MFYVYVIESLKDSKLYYGFTTNIEKRIEYHNSGMVKSTSSRIPFKLVYFERVETRSDALKKEKYFKSGFGRKYIKNKLKALSSNG